MATNGHRTEELLRQVYAREPTRRAEYLAQACEGDPQLLEEALAVLSAPRTGPALDPYEPLPGLETEIRGEWAGREVSHYSLIRRIGRGGMGDVYLARHLVLGRQVALKLLRSDFTRDASRLARFRQEARVVSTLNHPNILTLHEIGEADGVHFIVTEHVDGVTLRDVLGRRTLSVLEVAEIGIQITSALCAAHQAGIVHRDIKPDNVMWRPDGLVKVLDFGLAKLGESDVCQPLGTKVETDAGLLLGTLRYLSPEQAGGTPVDARTDFFSLGVLMFELLTGQLPFPGETGVDVLVSIMECEPLSLGACRPDILPHLEWVIEKALRKDRDERYQLAKELLADLRATKREIEQPRAPLPAVGAAVALGGTAPRRVPTWPIFLAAALLLLGLLTALAMRPPAVPRIVGYVPITRDGLPKSNLATDGSRLYFSQYVNTQKVLFHVSSAGGESVPLTTFFTDAWLLDISPDGRELLVSVGGGPPPYPGALWSVPVLGGAPRRIGDLVVHYALWADGGQSIVYSRSRELFRAKRDGTERTRIAGLPGLSFWTRFSPAGDRMRLTLASPLRGGYSLWELGLASGAARPYLPDWTNPGDACCGSWSPDGRFYYFSAGGDLWVVPESHALFGGRPKPVRMTTSAIGLEFPLPSLDGRRLYAIGGQWHGELIHYDVGSHEFVPYLGGISADSVDFSPDGKWVAYRDYPEGTLWRSRIDGSDRLQLTQSPMVTYMARWSPDGKRIAFTGASPGELWKVRVLSAEGGMPEVLLSGALQEERTPNWSPDGRSIVFGSRTFARDDVWMIQVVDLATRAVKTLEGSDGLFSPAWSPDGRFMLALRAGSGELRIHDLRSGGWEIPVPGLLASYPRWSKDGTSIYFMKLRQAEPGIYRMHVKDRVVEKLKGLEGTRLVQTRFASWMGLTPDDAPLVLRDVGTQNIYAVDLELP